jgi:hypothetical protein
MKNFSRTRELSLPGLPDGRWFVFARPDGANHIVVLQNVPELARRTARGTAAAR